MAFVFEEEKEQIIPSNSQYLFEGEEEDFSIPKQYGRGIAEGTGIYGDILDLLRLQTQETLPGKEIRQQSQFESSPEMAAFYEEEDIIPQFSRLPSRENIRELLKALGLEKEPTTFGEKAARRGGEITSSLLGFGEAAPIRALLAGLTGEVAQEAGAGPLGTFLAEMAPLSLPSLGKKVVPKLRQKELVTKGRELGLKEKELAPALFENKWWQRQLARIAPRRGKFPKTVKKSQESIGDLYQGLRQRPEAERLFSDATRSSLESSIEKELEEMPSKYRRQIKDDLIDFERKPKTAESALNLYQDINQTFGPKNKRTVAINKHIKDALETDFPELSKDFEIVNKLYGNNRKLASIMKPTLLSDLFTLGELGSGLGAIFFQNYPLLMEVAGTAAARKLAGEMVTNPRLYNLSRQMIKSFDKKSAPNLARLMKQYHKEIEDPEAKEAFDELFTTLQ